MANEKLDVKIKQAINIFLTNLNENQNERKKSLEQLESERFLYWAVLYSDYMSHMRALFFGSENGEYQKFLDEEPKQDFRNHAIHLVKDLTSTGELIQVIKNLLSPAYEPPNKPEQVLPQLACIGLYYIAFPFSEKTYFIDTALLKLSIQVYTYIRAMDKKGKHIDSYKSGQKCIRERINETTTPVFLRYHQIETKEKSLSQIAAEIHKYVIEKIGDKKGTSEHTIKRILKGNNDIWKNF